MHNRKQQGTQIEILKSSMNKSINIEEGDINTYLPGRQYPQPPIRILDCCASASW